MPRRKFARAKTFVTFLSRERKVTKRKRELFLAKQAQKFLVLPFSKKVTTFLILPSPACP
jgi:hypothetical protein